MGRGCREGGRRVFPRAEQINPFTSFLPLPPFLPSLPHLLFLPPLPSILFHSFSSWASFSIAWNTLTTSIHSAEMAMYQWRRVCSLQRQQCPRCIPEDFCEHSLQWGQTDRQQRRQMHGLSSVKRLWVRTEKLSADERGGAGEVGRVSTDPVIFVSSSLVDSVSLWGKARMQERMSLRQNHWRAEVLLGIWEEQGIPCGRKGEAFWETGIFWNSKPLGNFWM